MGILETARILCSLAYTNHSVLQLKQDVNLFITYFFIFERHGQLVCLPAGRAL